MARPTYLEGDATARDRLKEAFWDMLVEMPYPKISVRGLLRRTGFSKNTFYYHFESMDEMVDAVMDEALLSELGRLAMTGCGLDAPEFMEVLGEAETRLKMDRLALVLGGNGDALMGKLIERLVISWKHMLECAGYSCDGKERLMTFIAGGITTSLRGKRAEEFAAIIEDLRGLPGIQACAYELLR